MNTIKVKMAQRSVLLNKKTCLSIGTKNIYRMQPVRLNSLDTKLKSLNEMPGLSSLPLIGPLHHFLPFIGSIGPSGNFHKTTGIMHERFGPVVKLAGIFNRATLVMLFEPEDFEKVLRAEEANPTRPGFDTLVYYRTELRKSRFNDVYGLTTAQGPQWRDFRTKVNPALLMPKLIKLYTPIISEVAQDVVARIDKLKDDTEYMKSNFDLEMTKWALEAIAYISLGSRIGCLEDGLPDDHPGRQLMTCSREMLNLAFKLEFFPHPWRYIPTPGFKKLMNILDMQWNVSEMYIEEAKKKIKERGEVPEEEKSIIERLLAVDQTVAVMMANEMMMAGIDTVAFTTLGLLYHLAKNPEKQEKLREEVNSSDSKKSYLKACIKETLRIWSVVPANLRRTTKEHEVGGYLIPIGVDVVSPNEYLSNLDKYYVRAKEFIPERWIVDKSDPLYYGTYTHPMVTSPFGFGIRSCIGRRIAELEIEILVAELLQKFEISWDGPPIEVVTTVTNNFKKPFYFKFKSLK